VVFDNLDDVVAFAKPHAECHGYALIRASLIKDDHEAADGPELQLVQLLQLVSITDQAKLMAKTSQWSKATFRMIAL
jgi:hypothetical protein